MVVFGCRDMVYCLMLLYYEFVLLVSLGGVVVGGICIVLFCGLCLDWFVVEVC